MGCKVSEMALQENSWEQILTFLPAEWEAKCQELGAIRRFREFSDAKALLRVLLIYLLDGCSMRETVVRAREGSIADISDVAFLKRLNHAGEWFRWMAQAVMKEWGSKKGFDSKTMNRPLRAVDATSISEPGSTGTDWRIHYVFDLETLECAEVKVTDCSKGETLKNFIVEKDALYLCDRGYYHTEGIEHIVKGSAHVLVRVCIGGTALYSSNGKPFDILKHAHALTGNCVGDWPVCFNTKNGKVTGRICAIRKSDIAAQRSIEKIYREYARKQKTPTKATIEAAKYVIVFTTLPKEELPTAMALDFYRGRWQIELVFKRMKSILGLGHLPKYDPVGAKAWIHGKLFCAMLIDAFTRAAEYFSPWGYPLEPKSAT